MFTQENRIQIALRDVAGGSPIYGRAVPRVRVQDGAQHGAEVRMLQVCARPRVLAVGALQHLEDALVVLGVPPQRAVPVRSGASWN